MVNLPREKMKIPKAILLTACAASAWVLAACGGGSGGNATLGGSLSGLAPGLSVALQVNASNDTTLTSNQAFSFPSTVPSNRGYNVTVLAQPVGQICSIASGNGSVDSIGNNIGGIAVSCVSGFTIRGTVSGLAAGASVTLGNNGAALLPVSVNGAYGFPGSLAAGAAFAVTVSTQPAGQTCTLTNATGTMAANANAVVDVACL